MKLRMFHAEDGDCLLLTDGEGAHRLLIDGGRARSFRAHALAELGPEPLDVVCVSHIDEDHIDGIAAFFDAEVEWRRHEFEVAEGLKTKRPEITRPPQVQELWHNALYVLVGDELAVRAQPALALSAGMLRAAGAADLALEVDNLAYGERAGMEVARRAATLVPPIPTNPSSDGRILTRDSARGRRFGPLRVKVLGPSDDDIERLRLQWKKWVEDAENASKIEELRKQLMADEAGVGLGAGPSPVLDLGDGVGRITAPNLASIVLLVEDSETHESLLLTGDADSAEILAGLEHHGRLEGPVDDDHDLAALPASRRYHCTYLKVQHHGALANVTEGFVARVTADHYLFCGNGAHNNPEPEVVRAFAEARLAPGGVPGDFTFWFSSSADTPKVSTPRRKTLRALEAVVEDLVASSGGRMKARFLRKQHHLDVPGS